MGAHATQRATDAAAANGKTRTRDGDSLEQSVLRALDQYFADLDGAKPHALHGMVMHAVERPLLQYAMRRTNGNQSARRRAPRNQSQHAAQEADRVSARLNGAAIATGSDEDRADQRFRQDRRSRLRARPRCPRLPPPVHGRHCEAARGRRADGHRGRGLHGLSRDPRRPRQDPQPAHPCGPAGTSRHAGAHEGACRARHRPHRDRRGQPLPVRGDRREGRLHVRRCDREHRHRRPGNAARVGQEPRLGHGGRRPGRLRARARSGAKPAAPMRRCASNWRARSSPTRRATTA